MALSPNYTQAEHDVDEEAIATHVPDTEEEKERQDFARWCADWRNRQALFRQAPA